MITQARLKELLHYDPDTGVFTWLTERRGQSSAGSVAGKTEYRKGKSYRVITVLGDRHYSHRLAWLYVHGHMPEKHMDHMDGDGLNNVIANLRCVLPSENLKNKRIYSSNKTGYSGVTWNGAKWIARIRSDGIRYHLGSYDSIIDAVAAKIRANKAHGFHENHGTSRPL